MDQKHDQIKTLIEMLMGVEHLRNKNTSQLSEVKAENEKMKNQ
jgi:hypothetical protein